MQILDWSILDESARTAVLARPVAQRDAALLEVVSGIVRSVQTDGDAALRRLGAELDKVELKSFRVTGAEFDRAEAELDVADIAAIETAISNVHSFHAAQLPEALRLETRPGVVCERLVRPIAAVGLYVPAGSAPLPSTAIMLAIPAALAGCPQRILCTPPRRDGSANAAVLVAAKRCGITEVYKIGGAQAIAAMAYGTESVPKVAKIFGPGNAFVTAAKQLVASDANGAALDMPAGPSEVMVIADESANAEFVAADLLAQAEHDGNAQALLVTTSSQLAQQVALAVRNQLSVLSRRTILEQSILAMRLIIVPNLDMAIAVSERYAPEHLLIQTRAPRELLAQITNAGSVFLGQWSPEPMGDYCSGTNHVLPTYGYARSYSGLSVYDFVRRMTVQELSEDGLRALGPVASRLARLEGLDAHAAAVDKRLNQLGAVNLP
jgi:histidinol dehydrogenase